MALSDKKKSGDTKAAANERSPFHAFTQRLARLSASRINLYLGLGSDWLISVALLVAALHVGGVRPIWALLTMAGGLLIFSFSEYAAHRWLFHAIRGPLRDGHVRHHVHPDGYDALPFFLPPLIMCVLVAVLALAFPLDYALLLAGAVALGYALYGSSHTVLHTHRFHNALLQSWQEFHELHHDHPKHNFGVTTPLWDVLLGTWYRDTSTRRHG